VGSRHLQAGSLREWNLFRKTLTRLGFLLTRLMLGIPYDSTGAYRLYRLDRIPQAAFAGVASRGYSFFFESLYLLHIQGFRITETPIELPARTYGRSKMKPRDILNSLSSLIRIRFRHRTLPAERKGPGEPASKEPPRAR
jgi:dolichol-phosphate mannosyltransferase